MARVETTSEILTLFESIVDDSPDSDFELSLAEHVKNTIEADRPWNFLIKEDSSKTRTPSDTYLTAKTVPTDYIETYKVFLGDASLHDYFEIPSCPFHMRRKYNVNEVRYTVDALNGNMYITGVVGKTYTIYHYYIHQTAELDTSSANPVWPVRFRALIAFIMAEIYQLGVDVDDITVRQAVENNKQAKMLWEQMVAWDDRMKLKAMNGRAGVASDFGVQEGDGKVNIHG